MNDDLDKLFKKALENEVVEPPVEIWDEVRRSLNKPKVNLIKRFYSIVALLVLALGIAMFNLLSESKTQTTFLTDIPMNQISLDDFINVVNGDENQSESQEQKILSYAKASCIEKNIVDRRVFPVCPHYMMESTLLPNQINYQISRVEKDIIPLVSGEAVDNQEKYMLLLNKVPADARKHSKMKITLSGLVTPNYSTGNYSSTAKNTRGVSFSSGHLNGIMNIGGGLGISVSTQKRFSFQTGIFYSRIGQQYADNSNEMSVSAFYMGNGNKSGLRTPLGNLRKKKSKENVDFMASESITLNSASYLPEKLEQFITSVELPVHVRYRLNNNKVSFSVIGGISGGVVLNNKVYLESSGKRELLGSVEDLRKINFSADLGVGIHYPISKKIKIMMEPGFRYFLQSISHNDMIDYKPYTFTLSTGLGIEF